MSDPYVGREQTKVKHFILRHYLEALAFKVLTFSDIAYVDGFSGPWETRTEDFSDSSFMIAISVLKDAQRHIFERDRKRRRIRCFFSENNTASFAQLQDVVSRFHTPEQGFEVKTYCGEFADAVSEIQAFVGNSFALIFIDPTGWTGYPLDKVRPLFLPRKCEVLINFMYDYVNRFSHSEDEEIIRSLSPILGGSDWRDRLDHSLPRGRAVVKLFRETLKTIGNFGFVISTKIDKATAERPHFFITYGTKNTAGLKAFRDIEYVAMRTHLRSRADARERTRERRSKISDLFPEHHAAMQEATIDEIVDEQKVLASGDLLATLSRDGPLTFANVVSRLLQAFMLRETDVKDICVDLARTGQIENTWGGGNRKPRNDTLIKLKTPTWASSMRRVCSVRF